MVDVRLFFVFGTLFVQATRLFDGAGISEAYVKKYSGCITEITCPNNSAPFNSCYYLASSFFFFLIFLVIIFLCGIQTAYTTTVRIRLVLLPGTCPSTHHWFLSTLFLFLKISFSPFHPAEGPLYSIFYHDGSGCSWAYQGCPGS